MVRTAVERARGLQSTHLRFCNPTAGSFGPRSWPDLQLPLEIVHIRVLRHIKGLRKCLFLLAILDVDNEALFESSKTPHQRDREVAAIDQNATCYDTGVVKVQRYPFLARGSHSWLPETLWVVCNIRKELNVRNCI